MSRPARRTLTLDHAERSICDGNGFGSVVPRTLNLRSQCKICLSPCLRTLQITQRPSQLHQCGERLSTVSCSMGCQPCFPRMHDAVLLEMCLSESLAQPESLNVKTDLSADLFAASKLNCIGSTVITPGLPRRNLRVVFDVFRFTGSSKTRRGIAHRTAQVRSFDPQKFANQLSIHTLFRMWQFFLVVLTTFPAQPSRTLERCHVALFKQTLAVFVIGAQLCTPLVFSPAFCQKISKVCFVTSFAAMSRSVLSSASTSWTVWFKPFTDR